MTSEQFAYWLQGFSELNESPPTPEQWALIKSHLELVFQKVTPSLRSFDDLAKEQIVPHYRDAQRASVPSDLLRSQTLC